MNTIRNYYEKAGIPTIMINKKMVSLEKNPDIAKEFEHWIQKKAYITENAVSVENYTAEQLSRRSEFLDGEGAFSLLIQLRENPKKALRRIEEGFVMR